MACLKSEYLACLLQCWAIKWRQLLVTFNKECTPAHLFGSALLFSLTILSTLHNYSGLHVYSFCKILSHPAHLFRSACLFLWQLFATLHDYWGLHAYCSGWILPPARLLGSARQLGHKEYLKFSGESLKTPGLHGTIIKNMSICLPSLVWRKWNGFCLSRGAISSHEWPKVTSGWKWHRVRSKNHWIVFINQWRWTMSFSSFLHSHCS